MDGQKSFLLWFILGGGGGGKWGSVTCVLPQGNYTGWKEKKTQ